MSVNGKTQNWIIRGGWALADQGLFVFANVILNILLARWLTAAEYGAFAVAYSLFLFLGTFHTALITEPMLVFGAGRYASNSSAYLKTLLRGHFYLTFAGSSLLAVAALVLKAQQLTSISQALFGLSIAAPFSLLMWMARRSAYLRCKPNLSAIFSGVYLTLTFVGLLALVKLHALSVFTSLLVIGVAGGIAGFGLWLQLQRSATDTSLSVESAEVTRDHLRYGRWACATSILMWVPLNLFFVVLSATASLEASATLKALSNLVLPLLQANAALGSLLLPALVARTTNSKQFVKTVRISVLVFATGAITYAVFVGTFGKTLLHLLYGGRYDNHISLLYLLLLIPVCDGLIMVLSTALRAQQLPDRVFWSQLLIALFVLTAGVLASTTYGVFGAASAIVIAEILGVLALGISLLAVVRNVSGNLPTTTPALQS